MLRDAAEYVPRTQPHRFTDLAPLLARAPSAFAALAPAARQALLDQAVRHGLLAAAALCLPADDAALGVRFARLAAAARLRDARNREALEEVLDALARAGITPVALKGPLLADRLYPDPSLRTSTDLDLLVREVELDRAVEVLLALGFRLPAPEVEAYQRRRHHHLQLHRAPGPSVELHFRAHSSFGGFSADEPWSRAVPCRTAQGALALTLAPEDELVYLAVHAAGHLLQRAGWLLDLWLLLERHPALDWEVVADRGEALGCRRALAYGLLALRELGAPVPTGRHLALGVRRRWLADALSRAALATLPRARKPGVVLWVGFHLALRDRAWNVLFWSLGEAAWVARRQAHLAARRLTRAARRRRGLGPG